MSYEFSAKRPIRKVAAFCLLIVLAGAGLLAWMYHEARLDPLVRTADLAVEGVNRPLRLVLISDIHVAGPDMPPARLRLIVGQINRLKPDIVLIAGDFISDKRTRTRSYSLVDAIEPLRGLKSRLGNIAVLGNHDHWRDAGMATQELTRAGIRVLDNDATKVGPLTIGGVDDAFTGHDHVDQTIARMRSLGHPAILLSHSPDVFPSIPGDIFLTLAGHTHCGQIRLPLLGAVSTMSAFGERYACGRVNDRGRTLIVSAGLGTSILPLRLGTQPDLWVVNLTHKRP